MSRILLLDDEPALLRLMQVYLTRLGHEVQPHTTVESAKKGFAENGTAIEFLIADITLPDGSGEDFSVEMAGAYPELAVVLCSGYALSLAGIPEEMRSRFQILQKPFVPQMLAKCLSCERQNRT